MNYSIFTSNIDAVRDLAVEIAGRGRRGLKTSVLESKNPIPINGDRVIAIVDDHRVIMERRISGLDGIEISYAIEKFMGTTLYDALCEDLLF